MGSQLESAIDAILDGLLIGASIFIGSDIVEASRIGKKCKFSSLVFRKIFGKSFYYPDIFDCLMIKLHYIIGI